jgi:protein-disulfide isomerase
MSRTDARPLVPRRLASATLVVLCLLVLAVGTWLLGRVLMAVPSVTAALLEAQPDWHDGKMDGAWAAAEKAGLNVAKARAMPTADAMSWMEQDIADARAVGVKGTPTFFVNGEMLVQPSPEQVEARVQAAVAAKGK